MLKKHYLTILGISAIIMFLYFCLRLWHITSLPLFTDEAIYIRWAQIAKQDASWRFISLTDGKQPMYVWVAMVLLKFFKDPLFAGRLVSVIAGAATTIGLFFLGNEIFRPKQAKYKIFEFSRQSVTLGLLSSFIYVIYPFGLVYDRMALYDSLVGAFAVWALYLLFVLVRSLRLDVALIAGIVIGGGVLTKTNAFFSMGSMPFLLLIFNWKNKNLKESLIKFVGLSLVVFVVANAMYSILRLSPFYHIIADKNALFVYPIGEWLKHPFTYFWSNMHALLDWLTTYLSIPGIILILAAFIVKRDNLKEKIVLALWFLFPFVYLAFFGNTIYPRFILFMTLPLIPLIAYSFYMLCTRFKASWMRVPLALFAFTLFVYTDFLVLTNFSTSPIPKADTGQYVNSWSGGNGVAQSVKFFKEKSENQKIYIATEGTFGLMPFGLEMYFANNPNVKIKAYWPIKDVPPAEVLASAKVMPTYAIFYQPCPSCGRYGGDTPPTWHVKKILTFKQGTSLDYYSVYQILP